MRFYRKFQCWLRRLRHPPAVVISYFGQLTDHPQVHVSVHGMGGMQGVYTYDDNEQGNACATLNGRGLAHIAQIRLIDQRSGQRDL